MSLRDQILEQLTEYPEGLTSKELAPLCPSAEDDVAMIGRVIAGLRQENVIHPGTELRDGGAIWIFGPEKREAVESKLSLPYRPDLKPQVSDAARAIAAMRERPSPTSTSTRPVVRPAPPPVQPAVQPAAQQEQPMHTIREKIEALLKEHGPMDSRTMRKRGLKHEALGQYLADLVERKLVVRLGGGPRSSIYGLPGQKVGAQTPAPSPEKPSTPKKLQKAPKAKKVAKAKKAKAPRAPAALAPAPAPRRGPTNGDAAFAINEVGELGIEKEGGKLTLGAGEFERLREFIERTKPVWQGA